MADEPKKDEQTEREVRKSVDDYPPRPYADAVSKDHKAFLDAQEARTK